MKFVETSISLNRNWFDPARYDRSWLGQGCGYALPKYERQLTVVFALFPIKISFRPNIGPLSGLQ